MFLRKLNWWVEGTRELASPFSSGPEVRGSPDETPPCTVKGACCMQNPSWLLCPPSSDVGELSHPWRIRIVMACLRTIGNNPLRCSRPALNPTNLPSYLSKRNCFRFLCEKTLIHIWSILEFEICWINSYHLENQVRIKL